MWKLLLFALLLGSPLWASRAFNGTDQQLYSQATVDLSATQQLTLSFWLNWTQDDTSNRTVATNNFNAAGSFMIQMNMGCAGGSTTGVRLRGNVGPIAARIPSRPSAGVWHHWLVRLDFSKSADEIDAIYIDGVSQVLTAVCYAAVDNTDTFRTDTLFLMSRGGAEWVGGRLAEVAIWSTLLSANEVLSLSRSAPVASIRPQSLAIYYPLYGAAAPEADLSGHHNSGAVTGATAADHVPLGPYVRR
jgi:hypothetical protein